MARRTGLPPLAGREDTLDGLRGLLAIGVFLCHAFAWYGVIHHEGWHDARIPLFLHLGQSTVAMFFMLTAYLFFGRLLNARERPVDWLHLYVSRLLGRVAYSIYLLHGLMLYVVFMILVGLHRAAAWPDAVFWSVVVALSAVLVVLASVAFHLVELPGMRAVPRCVAGIRSARARMAPALRRLRSPRA